MMENPADDTPRHDQTPQTPAPGAEAAPTAEEAPTAESGGPADEELRQLVVETLKTVYDPEIPVNIYELGMIYDIALEPGGRAVVTMTLTSPSCPVAGSLPLEVEEKLRAIAGLSDVRVDLVWDPPWTPEKISEAAKLELGIF